MNLIKKSPGIYVAPGPVATIGASEVEFLRTELANNARGRVRINLHGDNSDPLHEMIIAIRPDSYIRPHKHPHKSESFHVVYGAVDIVIFSDDGQIRQIVPMAAGDSSKAFYYRMSEPLLHTLMIHSEILMVHEITNGPFVKDGSIFGEFAPTEDAGQPAIDAWKKELAARLLAYP